MALLALDSSTLGLLVHPRPHGIPEECRTWLRAMQRAGWLVVIPEIVEYELRRELLRIDSRQSIARLDDFQSANYMIPINRPCLLRAAELWAASRRRGAPTAHPERLDVDVILAAQVQLYADALDTPVILATTNVRHLGQFVDARTWQDIQPG